MSHCGPKTYHTKDKHFVNVYPQIYDMSIYDFKCGKLPKFRPSKIQKEWMKKQMGPEEKS